MTEAETRLNAPLPVEGTTIEVPPAIDLRLHATAYTGAHVKNKLPFVHKIHPAHDTADSHYLGRKVNLTMGSMLRELDELANAWYCSSIDDDTFIQGALHFLSKKRELEKRKI